MTGLTLATVLQASILMTGADSYTTAHKVTTKTGRPMVVLVGADWCAACVEMEKKVVPKVRRRGLLRRVAFAVVNLDRQKKLGRQLTGGGPIPQLVMYRKTSKGWRRRRLVGGQGMENHSFLLSTNGTEAFVNPGNPLAGRIGSPQGPAVVVVTPEHQDPACAQLQGIEENVLADEPGAGHIHHDDV